MFALDEESYAALAGTIRRMKVKIVVKNCSKAIFKRFGRIKSRPYLKIVNN